MRLKGHERETGKRLFLFPESPMDLDTSCDAAGRSTLREYRKSFVCVCMN